MNQYKSRCTKDGNQEADFSWKCVNPGMWRSEKRE